MPYIDAEKRKAYQREYYQRMGYERHAARRRKLQRLANFYKALCGCATCDEHDHRCLDYHHKDRTKKYRAISEIVQSGSMINLKAEIRKCIVLCANCHRKHHWPV